MKSLITQILINDALKLYEYEAPSAAVLSFLGDYVQKGDVRVLYINEGHIQSSSTIRMNITGDILNESGSPVSEYLTETTPILFVESIVESNDLLQVAFNNQIPLDRLTLNYDEDDEFNTAYQSKLRSVFEDLKPSVEFMEKNGMLKRVAVNEALTNNDVIREFLRSNLE